MIAIVDGSKITCKMNRDESNTFYNAPLPPFARLSVVLILEHEEAYTELRGLGLYTQEPADFYSMVEELGMHFPAFIM